MTQEIVLKNPTSLHEHPRNQEFFDDITGSKWEEFKTSIAQMGVMNPLIVTGDRCFAYARRVFENDILRTIIRSDLEYHPSARRRVYRLAVCRGKAEIASEFL